MSVPREKREAKELQRGLRRIGELARTISQIIENLTARRGIPPGFQRSLQELFDSYEYSASVRTANCLKSAGLDTIYALVGKTDNDLLQIYGFGRKCLNEVKEILELLGLRLGMTEEETRSWTPPKA